MRKITVTITENPARKEVKTFIECEPDNTATPLENEWHNYFLPKILAALAPGAKTAVIGSASKEELMTRARMEVDIREAGQ